MKLSETQLTALRLIAIGRAYEVKRVTRNALQRKDLIELARNFDFILTDKGFEIIGIVPAKPTENELNARDVQDQIIAICTQKSISFEYKVSNDMPSNITIQSLGEVVYPEYLDVLKGVLWTLKTRYNIN